MTVFGKILVFVNLALSLMMATWAFGVWTNRIDFSNTPPKTDQSAGEYAKRAAEIDLLWAGLPSAETGWKDARRDLLREEAERVADRAWYHTEMDHLRNRASSTIPARTVVYAANDQPGAKRGLILIDRNTGRPTMAPALDAAGGPLQSLAFYIDAEQKRLAELDQVQTKHEAQIAEAVDLTERLVGKPGVKGLQQRLVEERNKRAEIVLETELIQPLLVNAAVDVQLVSKRNNSLKARVEELKKVGVAVQDR
jgi:hypothetical protein